MKSVLRNDDGDITHAVLEYGGGNIFLTKKDMDIFIRHEVNYEETIKYFEHNDADSFEMNLTNIANGEWTPTKLKFDIMNYNDLFKDTVVRYENDTIVQYEEG